jgi:4-amino-4-deoxy-L-arabinose transferase-like glycosyltransferase
MTSREISCGIHRPGRSIAARLVLSEALPVLLVIAMTMAIRLPTWWNASIDIDEGMFALAGREVLRGRLPYTSLFDVKPIGLWLFHAAAQMLLGETLFAVRALGTACVSLTACLLSCPAEAARALTTQ